MTRADGSREITYSVEDELELIKRGYEYENWGSALANFKDAR